MKGPESKVKKAVLDYVKQCDPPAWHYAPVQMGMGESGIPDRIACVPICVSPDMVGRYIGVFVGIECKAEGEEPTDKQADQLTAITASHGMAFLAIASGKSVVLHRWPINPNDGGLIIMAKKSATVEKRKPGRPPKAETKAAAARKGRKKK